MQMRGFWKVQQSGHYKRNIYGSHFLYHKTYLLSPFSMSLLKYTYIKSFKKQQILIYFQLQNPLEATLGAILTQNYAERVLWEYSCSFTKLKIEWCSLSYWSIHMVDFFIYSRPFLYHLLVLQSFFQVTILLFFFIVIVVSFFQLHSSCILEIL